MQLSIDEIKKVIGVYLARNPEESKCLETLVAHLSQSSSSSDIVSRKNFVGHITASALVICSESSKVLLVRKPMWGNLHLQPGGHMLEDDGGPLDAAKRHLTWRLPGDFVERLEYVQIDYDETVPIDIDIHPVPANPKDNEPAHNHYDFRYVFWGQETILSTDNDTSAKNDPRWFDLNYLEQLRTFELCVPKILELRSSAVCRRRFFAALASGSATANVSTIAVAHILPDVTEYLQSLRSATDLRIVLAKPRSIDRQTKESLEEQGFNIVLANRHSESFLEDVLQQLGPDIENLVVLDIGGWFSEHIDALKERFGDRFLGVVEDTENGHQKYEEFLQTEGIPTSFVHRDIEKPLLPVPVVSVARSPLKDHEDYLIGQSIVYSADALLRATGKLLQYENCAVLGYGKIGRSIAHHLLLRGVKPLVFDSNPLRRMEAFNQHCTTPDLSNLISTSDILFSATGKQALNISYFRSLKNGAFVFSVTSSDDEFNTGFLKSEYKVEEVTEHVTKYVGLQNYFFLANDGNAVNFIHGAVVGDFIHLVKAEMVLAMKKIVSGDIEDRSRIVELTDREREPIAEAWLRVFLK